MNERLSLLRRRLPDRPRDLWDLLWTRVGRQRLGVGAAWLVWPVLGPLASLYRRTVLRRTKVVAIIGSFGKTTTARATAAVLGQPEPDRMNCWSYLARSVLRHPPGHPLVIEVGISRPGQMQKYARMLRPDVVVVTSIGGEHKISLGTIEEIQREKSHMVSGLKADGVAILNGDDDRASSMASLAPGKVVRFGFHRDNDVRAENARLEWPDGTAFELVGPGCQIPARVGLVGAHSVNAALAAAAVAMEVGLSPETIANRLESLRATPGRMQPVRLPSGAFLLRDDFKAGLETIEAALATLAQIPARRRIVVLGDISEPGPSQHTVHRRLGELTATVASRMLHMGRMFQPLASGARAKGLPRAAVTTHADVHAIAEALGAELQEGDVVLLKGRLDQKIGRVALILSGRTVGCTIRSCHATAIGCEVCPLLETGWGNRRPVT